jgi:CheY-like chemotaxis protein
VVLVVEDETLVRLTTAEYLRLSGYAVIEAADAAEAVAVFASGEPVDIVFSDVHLPGAMDGLKLAVWVHRHHRDIPVMLTSGHADAPRIAQLVGDEGFASKPYRQREVASRLRFLLEKTESL